MGRNTAIKRFTPTDGTALDLFDGKDGRLSVVLEILKSPWVDRGSELIVPQDAAIGKRHEEPIAVAWDGVHHAPSAFERHMRLHRIDEIVQVWAIERWWWDPRKRMSRRCWRVVANGGTYDLAYDRLQRRWLLLGIQD